MTLDLLFPNFEEIIRTPADVEKLNQAILDLAVRGRLVTQESEDEPAAVLLEKIIENKAKQEQHNGIEKRRREKESEMFVIPNAWEWTQLGEITDRIHYGFTASADETLKHYRLLRITDIQDDKVNWGSVPGCEIDDDTASKYQLHAGDILIARTGGTIGKSFLVDELPVKAVFASYLIRVIPSQYTNQRYMKVFLGSKTYWLQLEDSSKGTGQPNVNSRALSELKIPLPPLAEQHRIVAKVDELFTQTRALAAKLEQAQAQQRIVVAAALNRLDSAEDRPALQAAWATVRDAFDELYTGPENIAALRQSILDLAVRGRLVAQDRGDEPASTILEQIDEQRRQLIQDGKIDKPLSLPAVSSDEYPFELPDGWAWARLGHVVLSVQTGPFGSFLHKSDYVENGIPVVNPANIQNGQILVLASMTVSEETKKRLARYILEPGDIVLGRRGEMGRCALVTHREGGWLCGSGSFVLKTSEAMYQEFLVRVIRSPGIRGYLASGSVGSTMDNLNHRILNNAIMGVPPLAEQRRIVAKVDELMRMCGALEAKLVSGEAVRSQLTSAVLAGVVA